jgi:hypothetical protein
LAAGIGIDFGIEDEDVYEESATDSRTQSGPRRAPAGAEAGPPRGRPQIGFQNAHCQGRAGT